jgi:hypothetical protein
LKGDKVSSQNAKGYIGYFGLGDWWFSEFTEAERAQMEEAYTRTLYGPGDKSSSHDASELDLEEPYEEEDTGIAKGNLANTDRKAYELLVEIAYSYLDGEPEDRSRWLQSLPAGSIQSRLLHKAEQLGWNREEWADDENIPQEWVGSSVSVKTSWSEPDDFISGTLVSVDAEGIVVAVYNDEKYVEEHRHIPDAAIEWSFSVGEGVTEQWD